MTARHRAPVLLATLWAIALLTIAAWPASAVGAASVVSHQRTTIVPASSVPQPAAPTSWVACRPDGRVAEAHLGPFHEAWPAPAAFLSHLPSVERTSTDWEGADAAPPDGSTLHLELAHPHRWRLHAPPGATQCERGPQPARAPPIDLVPA